MRRVAGSWYSSPAMVQRCGDLGRRRICRRDASPLLVAAQASLLPWTLRKGARG